MNDKLVNEAELLLHVEEEKSITAPPMRMIGNGVDQAYLSGE